MQVPQTVLGALRPQSQDVGVNANASSSVNQPEGMPFIRGGIDCFFLREILRKVLLYPMCLVERVKLQWHQPLSP